MARVSSLRGVIMQGEHKRDCEACVAQQNVIRATLPPPARRDAYKVSQIIKLICDTYNYERINGRR